MVSLENVIVLRNIVEIYSKVIQSIQQWRNYHLGPVANSFDGTLSIKIVTLYLV